MEKAGYSAHKGIAAAGWPRVLFYFIQFTWCLTVNLVGLLVFLCCRIRFPNKRFRNSIVTCLPGNRGGLSLGIFIFLSVPNAAESSGLCSHEYGHTIQCLFLGPLYWIAVAVPSVVWCNLFGGYRKKHHLPYDFLYCERWATAWGKKWSGILSAPVRFCSFSPNRKCRKMAGKRVQPLNNYTCRFCPSSPRQADKSGLDGLQADK